MMKRSMIGILLASACLLAACGQHAESHGDQPSAEADPPRIEMTPELEAKLVGADRADGEEDHVVSACPGCGLAMEGSEEHPVHVGDYTLHFCSDRCLDEFSKDLEASLMALAVPGEDEPREEEAAP